MYLEKCFGCFNRYLAVRFPFRAKTLCTVKRAKMAVLSVLAIQMISHLPYFWRRFDPYGRTLSEKCNYALSSVFITVYEVVRMLVFDTALPCLGTLGFTVAMTTQLRVMMAKRLSEKPQVSNESSKIAVKTVKKAVKTAPPHRESVDLEPIGNRVK